MKKILLALCVVFSFIICFHLTAQASEKANFTIHGKDIPPPPTFDKITNHDFCLTGKGIPNKKILAIVYFPKGAKIYTTFVNSIGNFSINLERTLNIGTKFTLYQVGTTGLFGKSVSGEVKLAEPSQPPENQDKLSKPIVNPVYEKDRVITGKVDPNTFARATINGKVYSNQATASGDFTILIDAYKPGTKITVVSVKGTNQSEAVVTYVLANNENQTPKLKTPTISPVTTATKVVHGKADAHVTIRLKINDDIYEATTTSTGDFKIILDQLYYLGNKIEVYSYNEKGDKSEILFSEVSQSQQDLEIGIDYITSIDTYLTGMGPKNASLEIQVGNRIYKSKVDSLGNYSLKLARTYEAGTLVKVKATDDLSGKTESKSTFIYPRSPSINSVVPGADNIHGQADPGGYVTVYLGGKTYNGIANESGYYHIYVPEKDTREGSSITVSQVKNSLNSAETFLTI